MTPERVTRHRAWTTCPSCWPDDDGVLWVDMPEGDPDAVAGARRSVRLPPQGGAGQRAALPRAEGARLPRPRVRRPARAGSRGRRARPLRRARPVRRAAATWSRCTGRSTRGRPCRGTRSRPTPSPPGWTAAGSARRPATSCRTAIVSALTGRLRDHLSARTEEVWRFEQQVTAGQLGDAEQFLDGMFRVRHGLLTVRTMAALSREVYGRMHALAVFGADGPGPAGEQRRPVPAAGARWRTARRTTCRA